MFQILRRVELSVVYESVSQLNLVAVDAVLCFCHDLLCDMNESDKEP